MPMGLLVFLQLLSSFFPMQSHSSYLNLIGKKHHHPLFGQGRNLVSELVFISDLPIFSKLQSMNKGLLILHPQCTSHWVLIISSCKHPNLSHHFSVARFLQWPSNHCPCCHSVLPCHSDKPLTRYYPEWSLWSKIRQNWFMSFPC